MLYKTRIKELEEMQEETFHPEISQRSQDIARQLFEMNYEDMLAKQEDFNKENRAPLLLTSTRERSTGTWSRGIRNRSYNSVDSKYSYYINKSVKRALNNTLDTVEDPHRLRSGFQGRMRFNNKVFKEVDLLGTNKSYGGISSGSLGKSRSCRRQRYSKLLKTTRNRNEEHYHAEGSLDTFIRNYRSDYSIDSIKMSFLKKKQERCHETNKFLTRKSGIQEFERRMKQKGQRSKLRRLKRKRKKGTIQNMSLDSVRGYSQVLNSASLDRGTNQSLSPRLEPSTIERAVKTFAEEESNLLKVPTQTNRRMMMDGSVESGGDMSLLRSSNTYLNQLYVGYSKIMPKGDSSSRVSKSVLDDRERALTSKKSSEKPSIIKEIKPQELEVPKKNRTVSFKKVEKNSSKPKKRPQNKKKTKKKSRRAPFDPIASGKRMFMKHRWYQNKQRVKIKEMEERQKASFMQRWKDKFHNFNNASRLNDTLELKLSYTPQDPKNINLVEFKPNDVNFNQIPNHLRKANRLKVDIDARLKNLLST